MSRDERQVDATPRYGHFKGVARRPMRCREDRSEQIDFAEKRKLKKQSQCV